MANLPLKLTDEDIRAAALKINVPMAALKAVIAVECRGNGFKGDRPIILFERHVFYRNIKNKHVRASAVKDGLATAKWKRGYLVTQNQRYKRLAKATGYDKDAALMACSYGLGQVLGENWEFCGFSNIAEFVSYQFESEAAQLDTMCRYIVAAKIDDDLRALDWDAFALGYNGRGYKKNSYGKKLAAAYRKAGGVGKLSSARSQYVLRKGARGKQVRAVQNDLMLLGYQIKVDSIFGKQTYRAVVLFQRNHGLIIDGFVGAKTKEAIKLALKFS